jgi:hypothetical protein
MQAQWVVSGVIEASLEKTWQVYLETYPNISEQDKNAIKQSSQLFKATLGKGNQGKIYLEVDPSQYSIAVQGEWWYRGVHRLEPHPRGTLLTYSVYNIAPPISRWIASLVQGPEHARTMKPQLQTLLETIGKQLNSKTSLIAQ